jgi:hypothetical protein
MVASAILDVGLEQTAAARRLQATHKTGISALLGNKKAFMIALFASFVLE